MGLCDGSAATASGGAVTVARKAVWIGALNCRSARDAEGHPAAPLPSTPTVEQQFNPTPEEALKRQRTKAWVEAVSEGVKAGVWPTPAAAAGITAARKALGEAMKERGIKDEFLTMHDRQFADVLAFARTGVWPGDEEAVGGEGSA
jgi:hypothetical protein